VDLVGIREQFVKISGRYDLVKDVVDWEDNGANYYIRAAQDMLERTVGILPESEGRIWDTLAINGYYLAFQKRCRSIKEVWINSSTARTKLEKVDWSKMRAEYSEPLIEIGSGTPLYYCPAKLREVDATDKNATGTFADYSQADSKDYRGILILPPTDSPIDVEVLGIFYQSVLTNDTDTNAWTLLYPDVLIKAAIYQVEVFYSSKSRVGNILSAVGLDTSEIEKDVIEEEITDITQIEG
jgi:hypothetical protein